MSFATALRNRNSERFIALISAVAVVLSMMVMFASPAQAHHPETTAEAQCAEGGVVIAYTSMSWQNGSGHPNVIVQVSVNNGNWTQVGSGAYNAGNNYQFSGTFPGDDYVGQSIRVRSQVVGTWPNGSATGNTNPAATTAPFTVDIDCGPDEVETTFSISGSCVYEQETATFTISGTLGAGLTLEVAGQTINTAGPFSINVGSPGDYPYQVTTADGYVLAGGSPSAEDTISIEDCTPPPSGWVCENGEVSFMEDASNYQGTLYETEEEAANDPDCAPPPPPSGYACVNGEVVFIEDATDFEGTLYETAAEAADDADCIEVAASTTFTITGTCAAVDDVAGFTISGNLGEGVTLQVAGQTLTATGAFSIDVGAAGSYPYTVTLDDGFVLAEGSPDASATIVIEDCTPTITIETLGVCVNDAPWLYYSVSVSGDVAPGSDTVDIRWFSAGGVEGTDPAHNYLGLPLTGNLTGSTLNADGSVAETITNANRVPWVGLRLASDGVTPVDWPGWVFQGGEWLQQDDGFAWARQPGAFVELTVNPTGTDVLAYPPSTPTCSANPPDEVENEVIDTVDEVDELPLTGLETDTMAIAGATLLIAGASLLVLYGKREEES